MEAPQISETELMNIPITFTSTASFTVITAMKEAQTYEQTMWKRVKTERRRGPAGR